LAASFKIANRGVVERKHRPSMQKIQRSRMKNRRQILPPLSENFIANRG